MPHNFSTSKCRQNDHAQCLQLHTHTAADLENVINIESNLHTIYALEMSQIPLEIILSLLNSPSNGIGQVYHTELFQKAHQVFPRERKDLIQAPQPDNLAMANPIDQLILVRVLHEKSQDAPKNTAREYFDWKAFNFQKLNQSERLYSHCIVCPFGDIALHATSLLR